MEMEIVSGPTFNFFRCVETSLLHLSSVLHCTSCGSREFDQHGEVT